jgi:predicted DNA-binding transcriptional regulator AlpA
MSGKEKLEGITFLTLEETLEYMGIASATLLRYRVIDDFPKAVTVLGKQYLKRSDLDIWIEKYRRDCRNEIFDMEVLKEKGLLTRREARFYTGISDTTLIRHAERGTFPKPVYLFRRTFYERSRIDEWAKAIDGAAL